MKKYHKHLSLCLGLGVVLMASLFACSVNQKNQKASKRMTAVSIQGDDFYINGEPTFKGKTWRGMSIEGLLPNSRMVNGIFDDETDSTRYRWVYPDTKKWDAERNVQEFLDNMPSWREHGLLAFTINLQGGSPQGYSKSQPWCNTAIDSVGNLKPAYMDRFERVLNRADSLGMVAIVGLYYFGQEKYIKDEAAVKNGIKNSIEWILKKGYTNVLIEIDNECDFYHVHDILKREGVHRAVEYAKTIQVDGRRLLISVSNGGGRMPTPEVCKAADFILLHGNGLHKPARVTKLVERVRAMPEYTTKPIVFNEDDHFDFDKEDNNFVAATAAHASWGFFDYRMKGEAFEEGYQCIPADWGMNSDRKKGFFKTLQEWTK